MAGLQSVQGQRQLQFMPSGRQVNRPCTNRSDQHRHRSSSKHQASVHLLRLRQSWPAAKSEGCFLLSDHAGFLRLHSESVRLRLPRFGIGNFPQKWLRHRRQSELDLDTICAAHRRPDADVYGTQCGLAPPQCPTTEAPGPYFQKEFFHNGYIKSLKQLVHFYNTRDVVSVSTSLPDIAPMQERRKKSTAGRCPRFRTTSI